MRDPVLELLTANDISPDSIEIFCRTLGDPVKASDVRKAFHTLHIINKYIKETDSWTFAALTEVDFDYQARQFDLDLAVLVGSRSESLLAQMATWDVHRLRTKVSRLPRDSIARDDAYAVLTTLLLRILSQYSELELRLQHAISRSTLVKIHFELAVLIARISDPSNPATANSPAAPPLLKKYRSFVSLLVKQMDTTPFESVQQEMFQIVRDLNMMFKKFSERHGHELLDTDVNWQSGATSLSHSGVMADHSPAEWGADSVPDLADSSLHPQSHLHSQLHAESKAHSRPQSRSHRRSQSQMTSDSIASLQTESSIFEDLEGVMSAFDQQSQSQEDSAALGRSASQSQSQSRPQSRSSSAFRSPRLDGIEGRPDVKINLPRSASGRSAFSSGPLSSAAMSTVSSASSAPSSTSTPVSASSAGVMMPENLQVKKVSDRMMVKVGADYVDMQQWLDSVNGAPPPVRPAPLKPIVGSSVPRTSPDMYQGLRKAMENQINQQAWNSITSSYLPPSLSHLKSHLTQTPPTQPDRKLPPGRKLRRIEGPVSPGFAANYTHAMDVFE